MTDPQTEELSNATLGYTNYHSATAVHVVTQQEKLDAFASLFETTDNIYASLVRFVDSARKVQKPVAYDRLQGQNSFASPLIFETEPKGYFAGGLGSESDISSGTSESTYPPTLARSFTSSPLSNTLSPPRSVLSSPRIPPKQPPIGTGRIQAVPSQGQRVAPSGSSPISRSPGLLPNPDNLGNHLTPPSGHRNPLGIHIVVGPPEDRPAPALPKWNSNGRRFTADLVGPDDIPLLRDLRHNGRTHHLRPACDEFSVAHQKKIDAAFASRYMWPLVPFRNMQGYPARGYRPATAKRGPQIDHHNIWKYSPTISTPRVAQIGIRCVTEVAKSDEKPSPIDNLEKSLLDVSRYKAYNDSVEEALETNAMRRHLAERRSMSPVNGYPPGEFSDFPICEMSIAMGLHDASLHRNSSFND